MLITNPEFSAFQEVDKLSFVQKHINICELIWWASLKGVFFQKVRCVCQISKEDTIPYHYLELEIYSNFKFRIKIGN